MAFTVPSLETIIGRTKSDLNARLSNQAAYIRRSVSWATSHALAGVAWGLYQYQAWIADQVIVDTAESDQLIRWARVWGKTPSAATKATGTVEVSGVAGGALVDGDKLARDDGTEYVVTNGPYNWAGTSTDDVTIEAVLAGEGGNYDYAPGSPETSLSFVSPPAGIVAEAPLGPIASAADIDGGTDTETDASLLERLLLRIQNPPQGGAAADYLLWAQETEGVSVDRVWVWGWLDHGGAVNEVFVRFAVEGTGTGILPGAGEVTDVDTYLSSTDRKPVTALLDVDGVTGAAITYAINVMLDGTLSEADTKDNIVAEMESMYRDRAEPDPTSATIPNSYILDAIGAADGVDWFELTSVDGGAADADITLGAYEYPTIVLANVTLTVPPP